MAVLFMLASCGGGSVEFLDKKDANGVPMDQQITVHPGAMGTATLQLLASGAEAQPYTLTITGGTSGVTATANPAMPDPKDGVPLDITLTVTAAATAPTGVVNLTIEAVDKDGHVAGSGLVVNVM